MGQLKWGGVSAPTNDFKATQATDQTGAPATTLNQQDFTSVIQSALARQAQGYQQQQALAQQLQAEANGTGGPNLGEQLLKQATNQNIQSQAGAVASTRGLNPAQMARLISMNGANLQQQEAGQASTERMQEQLAAQQQLGGLYGQMQQGNLEQGQLGTQGNQGQNQTNLQNQQGANQLNQNTSVNNQNSRVQTNAQNIDLTKQYLGGAGSALNGAGAGGMGGSLGGGGSSGLAANGGIQLVDDAGVAALSKGGKVPGRAPLPGNNPLNDRIRAMLSPGEVVIPRTIADDPEAAAAFVAAVNKHKAKHGRSGAAR